jgi:uncharacterized delta-60 repeat protein
VKKLISAAAAASMVPGLLLGLATTATAAGTAGHLDTTFGKSGMVLLPPGIDAFGDQLSGVVGGATLLSNGDIVAGGQFGLARILPSGALDTTFGAGGISPAPLGNDAMALGVAPGGKYLLAGQATSPVSGTSAMSVTRFNANGSVDTTFGDAGVATALAPNSRVQQADSVLVQPDGKILIGGEAFLELSHAPEVGTLARFNANGAVDTSFGSGGVVSSASLAPVAKLGLDASGDIFTLPGDSEFSPAGQPRSAVTPAPITASSLGGPDAFLPSGQFVTTSAVGVARHVTDVQVTRHNANGTVAATSAAFDYSGQTGTGQGQDSAAAVAVDSAGRVLVAGSHFLGSAVFGMARLDPSMSLDAAFATNGAVLTSFQGDDSAAALLITPDGKVIAVGSSEDNSTGVTDIAIARYLG